MREIHTTSVLNLAHRIAHGAGGPNIAHNDEGEEIDGQFGISQWYDGGTEKDSEIYDKKVLKSEYC